jgi:hypothetical protein
MTTDRIRLAESQFVSVELAGRESARRPIREEGKADAISGNFT